MHGPVKISGTLTFARTAEQSEGGKRVGVDPRVITARECFLIKSVVASLLRLYSRCPQIDGED